MAIATDEYSGTQRMSSAGFLPNPLDRPWFSGGGLRDEEAGNSVGLE
jgi:hypothetical protein